MSNFLLFLLLIFFSFSAKPSLCEPRATQAAMICSNRTASMSQRQNFISNFLATMDAVTPLIATQRYATVVNGTGNTTVYTFGECMKDLSRNDCNLCFAQCKTQILRCLPFQLARRGGRVFFDGCYLRYDDYDFFNETLSSNDTTVCGKTEFGSGNKTVFGDNAIELVRNLSAEAVKNDGFFVGSVSRSDVSVFGLAQCWEPLTAMNVSACEDCLLNAVSRIRSCIPMEEGRALNAGCYLRYSTQRFYYNSSDPVPVNGGGSNKLPIILGTTSAAAFLLIVGGVVFFVKNKILQKRRVICGKKNNSFTASSSSILQMVWDLYGRRRLHEAVDPVLQSNFREEEASRLLQIGLLCVQASAELRPSMSMVVKMLKENHEIPEPTQPPFLNPSSRETSITTTSATKNSKPESYSQSSGNSLTQSWIDPR
ncbi:hypothetical protein Q3G72_022269 [Acer saccharum]|nr:hypothetical protein Q3G72_022269 [Acer saccharum]